jgi:hypothetical protein
MMRKKRSKYLGLPPMRAIQTAPPRTLTVPGVTERYGWSRSMTYLLLGEGRLRGRKMGTRLLIDVDSCDEVVAALPPAVIKPQRPIAADQHVAEVKAAVAELRAEIDKLDVAMAEAGNNTAPEAA